MAAQPQYVVTSVPQQQVQVVHQPQYQQLTHAQPSFSPFEQAPPAIHQTLPASNTVTLQQAPQMVEARVLHVQPAAAARPIEPQPQHVYVTFKNLRHLNAPGNQWENCEHITMEISPDEIERQIRRHDIPGEDLLTVLGRMGIMRNRHIRRYEEKLNKKEPDPSNWKWVLEGLGEVKSRKERTPHTFWAIFKRVNRRDPAQTSRTVRLPQDVAIHHEPTQVVEAAPSPTSVAISYPRQYLATRSAIPPAPTQLQLPAPTGGQPIYVQSPSVAGSQPGTMVLIQPARSVSGATASYHRAPSQAGSQAGSTYRATAYAQPRPTVIQMPQPGQYAAQPQQPAQFVGQQPAGAPVQIIQTPNQQYVQGQQASPQQFQVPGQQSPLFPPGPPPQFAPQQSPSAFQQASAQQYPFPSQPVQNVQTGQQGQFTQQGQYTQQSQGYHQQSQAYAQHSGAAYSSTTSLPGTPGYAQTQQQQQPLYAQSSQPRATQPPIVHQSRPGQNAAAATQATPRSASSSGPALRQITQTPHQASAERERTQKPYTRPIPFVRRESLSPVREGRARRPSDHSRRPEFDPHQYQVRDHSPSRYSVRNSRDRMDRWDDDGELSDGSYDSSNSSSGPTSEASGSYKLVTPSKRRDYDARSIVSTRSNKSKSSHRKSTRSRQESRAPSPHRIEANPPHAGIPPSLRPALKRSNTTSTVNFDHPGRREREREPVYATPHREQAYVTPSTTYGASTHASRAPEPAAPRRYDVKIEYTTRRPAPIRHHSDQPRAYPQHQRTPLADDDYEQEGYSSYDELDEKMNRVNFGGAYLGGSVPAAPAPPGGAYGTRYHGARGGGVHV